jgi:hypothetical protein
MSTYQIDTKTTLAVFGVFFLLVGLLLTGGATTSLVNNGVSDGLGFLIGAGIGAAVAYLGWLYLWRRVYEVRLSADGSIEIFGVLRHLKIAGSDVIELRRELVGEDRHVRELHVLSRRGTMLIPYFDNMERLIADIRAQNPRIDVTGNWFHQ